jgi:sugar lactone lactonase YvrE
LPENRFNDGKTDRQGRLWAGSLHDLGETKPSGSLSA